MSKTGYLTIFISALLILPGVSVLLYRHNASMSANSDKHGIVWGSAELKLNLAINRTVCPVAFDGFNTENKRLKIENVTPSCGCVTIESAPEEVNPRASFQLLASVYVPQSERSIFETIAVQTKDRTDLLGILITRPVYMTIEPRAVIWKDGSNELKNIKLTFWKNQNLNDIRLTYDATTFEVTLQKTSLGNVFDLSLFPKKKSWKYGVISVKLNRQGENINENIYALKENKT